MKLDDLAAVLVSEILSEETRGNARPYDAGLVVQVEGDGLVSAVVNATFIDVGGERMFAFVIAQPDS